MRPNSVRALVAAAILVLLSAGSVAAESYTDTSHIAAGPLPASMTLPGAAVGDRAIYMWDRVHVGSDGSVQVLDEHDAVGFEWLPPAMVADAAGVKHDALMLHQWGWQLKDYKATLGSEGADGWEPYAEPVYAIGAPDDTIYSYSYLSGATSNTAHSATETSAQTMFVTPRVAP